MATNKSMVEVEYSESEDIFMQRAREAYAKAHASLHVNWDELATPLNEYFIRNPALRNVPMSKLVNRLYEHRLANDLKDASDEQRDAARERLAEVLPAYLRENSDQFFIGRKTGVAIKYAYGDNDKTTGDQLYRWTDEEWSKLTKSKGDDDDDKAPASK